MTYMSLRMPYISHLWRCLIQRSLMRKFIHAFQPRPLLLVLPPFFVIQAIAPKRREEKAKVQKVIESADILYEKALYTDLYNLLRDYQSSEEPEILWRLSRSMYEMSRSLDDGQEKIKILESALDIVEHALALDEKCWPAHKWCGILLDCVWKNKDTKSRILHSYEIKQHFERAIELNPNDSTSYYLLGEWCYAIADIPWYQKKGASLLFATLPSSSYEEAYSYFEKAELIQPGFYSMNFLMMGKSLMKLNKKKLAIYYLKKARDFSLRTPDDKQANEESQKILKQLGVIE